MANEGSERINQLINLTETFSVSAFQQSVQEFLDRKDDKQRAIAELEVIMASVQNHFLTLSMHLKINYVLKKSLCTSPVSAPSQISILPPVEEVFYSRRQLAKKIGVSTKTISNWVKQGLDAKRYGRDLRISMSALEAFGRARKTTKLNFRSIAKPNY